MRKLSIYLMLLLCFFANKISAQQTFETKAKLISENIEKVTNEEKEALKKEVEQVNVLIEKGTITKEQADEKKLKLAQARATIIEGKVAIYQQQLNQLVQDKVDGKLIGKPEKVDEVSGVQVVLGGNSRYDSIPKNKTEVNIGTLGVYKNNNDKLKTIYKRTTSQLVFAEGYNNLLTNGSLKSPDYGSLFTEIGLSFNTRIFKNNNLLHFKYGLTGVYNNLRLRNNKMFVDANEQTFLVTAPNELNKNNNYFKNVFVSLPVFLEFDFSKNAKTENGFKIQQGFRFGLGGFVGYNTNSKQFLSYDINGYNFQTKQKGNWNIPDWNYGVATYFGYKDISLYFKYDLNPMFKNNPVKQNNISLGVRFDLN